MPLAKPIRANQRKQHAANARDRVVKLKGDIFQSTTILCEFLIFLSVTFMPALEPDRCDLVPRPTRSGGFESSKTSPRRINLVPA
ncbi:hypothetical protein PGT21_024003 [Puccinia graminis f. sp. tritici]|uniref:Uncharacterized protein n=2 Tax=Puccinia graminis f. sp. tritici TaxID=56615 RepID=E3KDJ6_PUCGT|nr:uncharacterized protein PGTG_08388 [Puccinia graminis f. sp. tritici CRL 75-36-700-3]EFP82432.2 hypothetical protein PGTG_08388 [Puccinia graminis f. sp. tritici CRL 75-36-700-3]KAA1079779.1 hypothetical protein PGT21_024003 [Puccinia graminis f. sp. tritici]